MSATAAIGPLAYDFFVGMQGRYSFEEFRAAFDSRLSVLGPAPRTWDRREALDWAREFGALRAEGQTIVIELRVKRPIA